MAITTPKMYEIVMNFPEYKDDFARPSLDSVNIWLFESRPSVQNETQMPRCWILRGYTAEYLCWNQILAGLSTSMSEIRSAVNSFEQVLNINTEIGEVTILTVKLTILSLMMENYELA